jgi:lipoyl synthase
MASPETVRLSMAAAMTLGFRKGRFYRNARLGCINLLMENDTGCRGNCLYCGQAREVSRDPECKSLIRVEWPSYPLSKVIEGINSAAEKDPFIQRVCVSALTAPSMARDLLEIVKRIKSGTGLRVSALITPTSFSKRDLEKMRDAGAENITIAMDTATPELFRKMRGKGAKGPHRWERYLAGIREAVDVMGNGGRTVGVHLIIGLGETEEDAVRFIQTCHDLGARAHLFSFFPERGSAMAEGSQPPMEQYRRVQLARHLIHREKSRCENMQFESGRITEFGLPADEIAHVIQEGTPFMTTGCPGCNRPYANETPSQAMNGLLRNYPFHPAPQDMDLIETQMGMKASG